MIKRCQGVPRCLQVLVVVFALLMSGCGFADSSGPWPQDQWGALPAGERVIAAELPLLQACHGEPDTSDADSDCDPPTSDVVPGTSLAATEPGWYGTTFACGGKLQLIRLSLDGELTLWIGPIWDDRPLDDYASYALAAFGDRALTNTMIDIAGTRGVQIQASEGVQLAGFPDGSPGLGIPATFMLFKAEPAGLFFAVLPHDADQTEFDTFVAQAMALTDTFAVDVPRTRGGCS